MWEEGQGGQGTPCWAFTDLRLPKRGWDLPEPGVGLEGLPAWHQYSLSCVSGPCLSGTPPMPSCG